MKGISRRGFMGSVAAPWFLRSAGANEKITAALIGNGVMGSGHLNRLLGDPGIQVLAVCDVDRSRREEGKQRVEAHYTTARNLGQYTTCAAVSDYRELLARPDLDAVVVVTPDHWHAVQAADAARAGKDVYCEKPVSLTLREGRRLADTMRRTGRVFQTGTQYRSMPTIRAVCEFVRAGGLGRVKSVFTIWSSLGGFIGAPRFAPYAAAMKPGETGRSNVPLEFRLPEEPVPEGLDWDLWVGPAPWRPYNRLYHTNPAPGVVPWSFCDSFGAASVTWHHSHSADVIQYALGMEQTGPVEILHPSSGAFPTLTCRYANGTLLHLVDHWGVVRDVYRAVPPQARLAGLFGGVFVGERGWITSMTTGGPIEGGPDRLWEEIRLKTREVSHANNHHANWFDCIRTRGRPSSHEEIGHRSASLGHLTALAYALGRSLKWDPVREEFAGDDEANRLRSRAMREPWRI
jgi:hypothetical protein